MKENSFKRNRKAMMALLLCTGFIVTQPISVMAEEIMIFAQTAQQQKQSVSGVIKDATGEPVIGASVLEKGTTNGTITDFDGRFTLNVIPGTTLIISYIGYKTIEMKTVAGQPINLTLIEDSEMLEEVVVVGYGTMRKKDLTGSVVQINPSKIADQNPTSVQDVLRGTPGLQIGYDASAKFVSFFLYPLPLLPMLSSINVKFIGCPATVFISIVL